MADAINYTAATGKRPFPSPCKKEQDRSYGWFECDGDADVVPGEVFDRLEGGELKSDHVGRWRDYPTEAAALKAADEAYLKAVADGAMAAIGEGVA